MKKLLLVFFISGALYSQNTTKKDSVQTTNLKEVVLVVKKKAIEQKSDRTIINFSDQPQLNSGSLLEGLKKLPGLIISDVAGMTYQGKQLEVYMDGRPLNIYSNELNSYLESLPANSVEKIEIITQPGAEFPATSGGAIINIISSRTAKRYISATYSNGYSYTNYDKSRHRFNNSILLNAKNSLFGWQLQAGQNYSDGYQRTKFYNPTDVLSQNETDRINRFYFIKSGLTFDFDKDRLLVNYDYNTSNNAATIGANGLGFVSLDDSDTKQVRNEAVVTYQKRFANPATKLDFRLNYNQNQNDFQLAGIPSGNVSLQNSFNQNFYQFKTDYSKEIKLLDEGKWSAGFLADKLDFKTTSFDINNLEYKRNTTAAYTQLSTSLKKFEFIVGGRLESYTIEGKTVSSDLTPFSLTKFFPNATLQYNIMSKVFMNANYNKKISLPNTSALNPNNTNYQNPNVSFFGNPNLSPTIYDNYEVKISAFDYMFIKYSISDASNAVVNRIVSNNNGAASISTNIPKLTVRNFSLGLPIPYMLFSKGIKETLKFNVNPDELNFLYVYVGNQKHLLEGVESKGFWNFNFMSQIQLPHKIKFTANYNTATTGGNYQYYKMIKPFSKQFDLTFSKKFMDNDLSISIYANDIFNTNRQELGAIGTNLLYDSKNDTRRIGLSMNYKIPTRNKLAKVQENMLNNDKNEEDSLLKK
ncbi:TonB-dependent receptor [Flavobacterium faecale]|uniref:TonB-dependent receptor n=1 Tax=Flavobacterium faecale TaxID=1355330 RepID=A0A2S1LE27_9FLAO|nr:outer membrane beta-barrel family protein [Flavobacterium faecale]AWG22013.1 TonB-dependent receptor [Flavobacterium faecale]